VITLTHLSHEQAIFELGGSGLMRFIAQPSTVFDKRGLKKIYKTNALELLIIMSGNPAFDFSQIR
jgi:hypothetical protein